MLTEQCSNLSLDRYRRHNLSLVGLSRGEEGAKAQKLYVKSISKI